MDNRLIEIFRATIDPNQRQQAEEQLVKMEKIIGFVPSLLQMVMSNEVEMPIRQAGTIYLKNLIMKYWYEREVKPGEPLSFAIHEQDKAMIRDSIIDAVVLAPNLIKLQLCVCLNTIVKSDFPGRWTQIVDKISIFLQNPDPEGWSGALLCLYQLVKSFTYKKAAERAPLNDCMKLLLPQIYGLCVRLMPDESKQSVLLQKQILKIYYRLTENNFSLNLIDKTIFSQWMEVCRQVVGRGVPDEANQLAPDDDDEDDERAKTPWWKCKKWAMRIVLRMFERYGSPGKVDKEFQAFATWYLKTFTTGIVEVLFKLLDQHRKGIYVSPRVVRKALSYLNLAVSHAFSWKILKAHMFGIIQDVVFPLMSHSKEDEELWSTDPKQYVRIKFDVYEDYVSPVNSAALLLHAACKKRKDMLNKSVQFIMQVLTSPNAEPQQKDGALHMVGTLAPLLFKKDPYKSQMEPMLVQYVYPLFSSQHGFLRARVCWVIHYFSEMQFKNSENLANGVQLVVHALLNDAELPVRVEAAVAIQIMLESQDIVEQLVEPHIMQIAMAILHIIRETEIDELNTVMEKIVGTYPEQLKPAAVDICQHLATTFRLIVESDQDSDEKALTAIGLMSSLETLLSVMEGHAAIMASLEPILIEVVYHVMSQSIHDFYEEALSLVYNLTLKTISQGMWKVFELIYQVFEKDGFDYFTDMMPALHNYITIDTDGFLSCEGRVMAIFNMCKRVLTGDGGDDAESHAAKLLEVMILQCKGRIDQCIPWFMELVLQRLMQAEIQASELRTMCLQVLIAALYYNPQLFLETMAKLQCNMPPTSDTISGYFIKQWINDTDCFLGIHDRKLCVLGLCMLLSMGPLKPQAVNEYATKIIPSLILLFDGLKKAYEAKAQEGNEEEEEEEEENSDFDEVLSSDEDDIDEYDGNNYLSNLEAKINKKSMDTSSPFSIKATIEDDDDENDDDDDDDDSDFEPTAETALECYTTPLDDEETNMDEFVIFQQVLGGVQNEDPMLYQALTSALSPKQQESLRQILVSADQRKAAVESKRIEQSGGYAFVNQTVPKSFKFGEAHLGR